MKKAETLADFLGTVQLPPEPDVAQPELSVKDFCRGVLESREYRQSVLNRITLGTLPPAVECKMYDYAYGKPVERVEHAGVNGRPIESITEVRRVVVHVNTYEEPVEPPARVTH